MCKHNKVNMQDYTDLLNLCSENLFDLTDLKLLGKFYLKSDI